MNELITQIDILFASVERELPPSRSRSLVLTHLEDARYRLVDAVEDAS